MVTGKDENVKEIVGKHLLEELINISALAREVKNLKDELPDVEKLWILG
jgi:hypothetical protein